MEVVKKIKLIFENCEVIDITKAVGDFSIEGISKGIHRVASNCVGSFITADFVKFQIYGDGEFKNISFSDRPPFDRILTYNDITGIELTYNDDTIETIYPVFEGEEINKYQTTKEYKGDIFIVISKDKSFDSVYSEEFMNECIDAKDFCMDHKVKAVNELTAEGWKVVFDTEDALQIYKDRQSVVFSKDYTNISFFYPYKSYLLTNERMKNICSLIFDLCFMRRAMTNKLEEEYKQLIIDNKGFFSSKYEGDVNLPFSFFCKNEGKRIQAKLVFDRKIDGEDKILDGYIEIEDYRLNTKELFNFLWIVQDMGDN